jgi:PKD domain
MDGGLFTTADIQILREQVIDQGKRLIFMGGTCWADFATGVNTYLVANDTGNYCWQVTNSPQWTVTDPSNGLAEGMPDSYDFIGYYGGYYSIRVTDDTPLVAGVNGENWPAFFYKGDYGAGDFIWLINSAYYYYWADPSDYAYLKQALTNALNYSSVKKDVTWLFEEPVSGTVPAGTVQDVGIFLTSQYTDGTPMPLGTYTATLTISTNDPVTPKPKVTVIMHVVKEYLAPVPEFTASTVGVGNPTEFLNNSDPGIPPTKAYEWDFGDGITMTVGTAAPVYHTYTTFGTFTVTLTACNVVDCVTVVHDVTVLPKEFFLPLLNKN